MTISRCWISREHQPSLTVFLFPQTADSAHRLNLLYLANDVIQNCKRKNAIVYRTAFAELLPDAFLLVRHFISDLSF
uniref:CID domain-containing protein n=1 Tax=Oryzias sinensis TaxID=183150 RepID=A0A8C7WZ15_9TELE